MATERIDPGPPTEGAGNELEQARERLARTDEPRRREAEEDVACAMDEMEWRAEREADAEHEAGMRRLRAWIRERDAYLGSLR